MAPPLVLAFVGGLIAGSFTTAVAHRVPRGESIVGPRSRCPACGTQIAARDNLPVVSWLLLRGLRVRMDTALTVVRERRSAQREVLRARLRGDDLPDPESVDRSGERAERQADPGEHRPAQQ